MQDGRAIGLCNYNKSEQLMKKFARASLYLNRKQCLQMTNILYIINYKYHRALI